MLTVAFFRLADIAVREREGAFQRKGKGREEGKVAFWKGGEKRMLLRDDRDPETQSTTQWKHCKRVTDQVLFFLPWALPDVCQCASVLCFCNHISGLADKLWQGRMRLFSLSHQQLGLSSIRPVGPKLLFCAAVNWLKQILETQHWWCLLYVTPTAPDVHCRLSTLHVRMFRGKIFASSIIGCLRDSSEILFRRCRSDQNDY